MSGRQKTPITKIAAVVTEPTADLPTIPKDKRKVQVGDVVLYAQPFQRLVDGSSGLLDLPLIVTAIHNDGVTVDGVIFATSDVSFHGTRLIYDVAPGEVESTWKWKD